MSIKWFFALNDAGNDYPLYCLMTQVAVRSARCHTQLEPIFLFDGEPCALTAWMQDQGVRVIHHRTSMFDRLVEHARATGRKQSVNTGAGAYLRLDIPLLCERHGIADTYALYTDCDVMFRADPAPWLRGLEPEFFAAAPQFDRHDPADMNSGVLWMNLPRLRQMYAPFCAYIREHMDTLRQTGYDQAALRAFYGARRRGGPAWDALPAELNWKPHWGRREDAAIVHFHGPKPTSRTRLSRNAAPQIYVDLAGPDYYRYCAEWDGHAAGLDAVPVSAGRWKPARLDPLPLQLPDFDEDAYLRAHPDVARAVALQHYGSGLEHYRTAGLWEGRRVPAACRQAGLAHCPDAAAAPVAPPVWERAASRCWAALTVPGRLPEAAAGGELWAIGTEGFVARLARYADRPVHRRSARDVTGTRNPVAGSPAALVLQLEADDESAARTCAWLDALRGRLPAQTLVLVWVPLPRPAILPTPLLHQRLAARAQVVKLHRQIGTDRHDLLVLRLASATVD